MIIRCPLAILLVVFAFRGFVDGDFKVTRGRIVDGLACQFLEVVLVVGAGLALFFEDTYGFIAF